MTEILDFAKDGQYHLACVKYFEVTHNKPASKPLLHPNAYFAESRAILTEDDGKGKKRKQIFKEKTFQHSYYVSMYVTFYFADVDNKEKSSLNTVGTPGGLSSRRSDKYPTPRSTEFTGTPKRNDRYVTPTINTDGIDTPLRKDKKTSYQTPSRKNKMTPVNIAEMLNDDDFTEFMDVVMES